MSEPNRENPFRVVPQGYPSPQTEVHSARDVGFPAEPRHKSTLGDMSNVIPGEYKEVTPDSPKKGAAKSTFRGEMGAIGREAIKDIRSTLMQVFFGQHEKAGEPGAPLNPTQIMVTREIDGQDRGMER